MRPESSRVPRRVPSGPVARKGGGRLELFGAEVEGPAREGATMLPHALSVEDVGPVFPVARLPCDCSNTQPTPAAARPSSGKGRPAPRHPGLPDRLALSAGPSPAWPPACPARVGTALSLATGGRISGENLHSRQCDSISTCVSLFTRSVVSGSFENPVDCSPPGSSVHGISQARILE